MLESPPDTKAAIVFHPRCGSTLLAFCLSNHPQVFCLREETFHPSGKLVKFFDAPPGAVASYVWSQPYYETGVVRATYAQMNPRLWKVFEKHRPKIIFLYRENVLRAVVSGVAKAHYLKTKNVAHRPISAVELPPAELQVNVRQVLLHCRRLARWIPQMRSKIKRGGYETMELTYSQLVGSEGNAVKGVSKQLSYRICKFLGIKKLILRTQLRRVHPFPLSAFVKNWKVLEAAIEKSEFAYCLKDEAF